MLTKAKRQLILLAQEYEARFGVLPPLKIMDDPIPMLTEALQTNTPYNPLPGDGTLPDDAVI